MHTITDTNHPFLERAFYNNRRKAYGQLIIGILFIAVSVWQLTTEFDWLILLTFLLGLFLTFYGAQQLATRSAQLRVGQAGLWTPKHGFLPWKQIQSAKVIRRRGGFGTRHLILQIEWNQFSASLSTPDEVYLSQLEDAEEIESVIDEFLDQHRSNSILVN